MSSQNMFNICREEITWGGSNLILETGKIARQATGAIVATYGGTTVLATVVANKEPKEDVDFFPLTVEYVEKLYAIGRIPGGFLKREGKPTDNEVLTARLIDRPIRPLFPENFFNETVISLNVISYDKENNPDIIAMIAASAALAISGIPFDGPIAGARVGLNQDGQYVLNPTKTQMLDSKLDLVVAGTESSVMMVESEAILLSEEEMLNAVKFGHEQMQPIIQLIKKLADKAGKPRWEVKTADNLELKNKIIQFANSKIASAYNITTKAERYDALSAMRKECVEHVLSSEQEGSKVNDKLIAKILHDLEAKFVRENILDNDKRIDGRNPKEIRMIECGVSQFPGTHGSALFTRGETQAIVISTLGSAQDSQRMDSVHGAESERFMLHYNFPAFSVGEARPSRGPGRREIGHGKLAWRSIHPLMPTLEEFPYAIRVVSEITESNGSSSMATVCGTSLSLMDAGVPLKEPVAGIAMGLIKEGDKFKVLSDIMGDEDHLGDMDFKVAGTSQGITSLQMDIKIQGISPEIMQVALNQAKDGRLHILNIMNATINSARTEVNEYAPRITTIKIPKEKIREVIGSGGKVIQEICAETSAQIDIKDDGTVNVAAVGQENTQRAVDMINAIVLEPEYGKVYNGKVIKILDSGIIVQFFGKKDGMVRIGDINNTHIDDINDHIKLEQEVKVVYLGSDNRGRSKISMRTVNQETGETTKPQYSDNNSSDENGGGSNSGERGGYNRYNNNRRDNNRDSRPPRDRNYDRSNDRSTNDRGGDNYNRGHDNRGNRDRDNNRDNRNRDNRGNRDNNEGNYNAVDNNYNNDDNYNNKNNSPRKPKEEPNKKRRFF